MNRKPQTGPPRSGEVSPRRACQRLERAVSEAGPNARLAQDPHCSHINHPDQNVGAGELEAAGNLSRFPM